MRTAGNLLIIIIVGVIIANLVASQNVSGTTALFCNFGNLWGIAINGMLGQPYTMKQC